MPISDPLKVIFFHNPKSGGTTIEQLLDMKGPDMFISRKYLPNEVYSLEHLPYTEMQKRINPEVFDTYFKFTVVRDPWDRVVSTYCWNQRGYKTFEEFVDFIDRLYTDYNAETLSSYPEFNKKYCSHLFPQYIYTGKDVTVYRYEHFNHDVTSLLQQLNIQKSIPRENKSSHKHYAAYYTERTRNIIGKVYAEDIFRFGYKFETQAPTKPPFEPAKRTDSKQPPQPAFIPKVEPHPPSTPKGKGVPISRLPPIFQEMVRNTLAQRKL